MGFDSQDRLTGVSSPSLNIQYQYDGLFNRVSKTDGGATTKYLVDPNGLLPQVIAEMDGAYNITSYYVYDGIGLVAKMVGSNVYYYHYNGSGNTIAMTDSSGNMVNKYAYDPFGNLANVQESVPNPFLFVGQYGVMDDDNGLHYMRARYYDPQVGRFINKDPIRYWGSLNVFTYAGNNPVNWVDPWGLYLGQLPPPPPGYNPSGWRSGLLPNGRFWVQDPEGNLWIAHPEDEGHWRHWEKPGGGGKCPPNSKKKWPTQKRSLRPDQSETDPSGDAPAWAPNEFTNLDPYSFENIFIFPINPTIPRLPVFVPVRVPVPVF